MEVDAGCLVEQQPFRLGLHGRNPHCSRADVAEGRHGRGLQQRQQGDGGLFSLGKLDGGADDVAEGFDHGRYPHSRRAAALSGIVQRHRDKG